VVNLFPEFGNTVSASFLPQSAGPGKQPPEAGMEMMLFMGSAGFSVGICHMVY